MTVNLAFLVISLVKPNHGLFYRIVQPVYLVGLLLDYLLQLIVLLAKSKLTEAHSAILVVDDLGSLVSSSICFRSSSFSFVSLATSFLSFSTSLLSTGSDF